MRSSLSTKLVATILTASITFATPLAAAPRNDQPSFIGECASLFFIAAFATGMAATGGSVGAAFSSGPWLFESQRAFEERRAEERKTETPLAIASLLLLGTSIFLFYVDVTGEQKVHRFGKDVYSEEEADTPGSALVRITGLTNDTTVIYGDEALLVTDGSVQINVPGVGDKKRPVAIPLEIKSPDGAVRKFALNLNLSNRSNLTLSFEILQEIPAESGE